MSNPPIQKSPLLNRMLVLFMFAMILANMGSNMYGPLLALYLKSLNANVVQVGLFFTLSQIIPLMLQILGGWISDSLGRLRSIAMGSVAGLLTYVGLILAPTWQWVLVGEGFNAITRSLIGPSFSAFIAEQSTEQNRARVFGITETLFLIVSVVGPPLGGWLADVYGFKLMLSVAMVLYAIATVIRVGMARAVTNTATAAPTKLSLSSLQNNLGMMLGLMISGGLVTWILVTDGIRDVSFSLSFNLMPLYMGDIGGMSLRQIGLLQSIFGICMMVINIPAGWLADKKGERLVIFLGFLLQSVSLFMFIRASGFWGFAVAWSIGGLGVGLMSPAYQSLVSKAVPEKVRGTAFGLFSTSLGVVSLPAPAIGAQLWERVNPRFPFLLTAWASLLVMVPVWFKFKLPQANGQSPETSTKRSEES